MERAADCWVLLSLADDVKLDADDEDADDKAAASETEEKPTTSRASRSAYVGRGNVQAVRAARKLAGLSSAFPRSDPLLREFADFLQASGAAEKDISNKVMSQRRRVSLTLVAPWLAAFGMNEVNARRVRLVLGWVTVFGRVFHLGM